MLVRLAGTGGVRSVMLSRRTMRVVKQKPTLVRSDERIEMEAEYAFGLCFEGERAGWDRSSAQGRGADAMHIIGWSVPD